MTAQPPSLAGHEVVFRLDRGFRKPLVQRGALCLVLAGLAAAAGSALGPPMFVVAGLCGLAAAGYAVAYAWQGRFCTVLTPEGIHARGYFNHFIPWPAVADFTVHSHGSGGSPAQPLGVYRSTSWPAAAGTRQSRSLLITVQVVSTNRHRRRLRAPAVSGWQSDPGFDGKVRLMEQWRRQYGVPSVTAR